MNSSIETKLRNSGRRGSIMRIQRCQDSLDRLYRDSNIFQNSSSNDLTSSVKHSGEKYKILSLLDIIVCNLTMSSFWLQKM